MKSEKNKAKSPKDKVRTQNAREEGVNGSSAPQFHGSQTDPSLGEDEDLSVEPEIQAATILRSMNQDFKTPSESRSEFAATGLPEAPEDPKEGMDAQLSLGARKRPKPPGVRASRANTE